MLFRYNDDIFNSIFYDEINHLLIIKYKTPSIIDEYYLLDDAFFHEIVLVNLRKKIEFRNLIYWGIRNNYAKRIYDIDSEDGDSLDEY